MTKRRLPSDGDPLALLFAHAVADAPDGVHIVDLEGHLLYANKASESILGFSNEELVGTHVDFLTGESGIANTLVLPHIRERGSWAGQLIARRKDGRSIPISLHTSRVDDGNGEPVAIVGIFRDITERKNAEQALRQSEERFRSVFDEGPLGMAITDGCHRLQRVNDALAKLLCQEPQLLVGRTLGELMHPEDRSAELDRLGGVLEGECSRFELESRFSCRPGETRWLKLTSSRLEFDGGREVVGLTMVEDVSGRKRAEAALREAKERAEAADRIKSEFLDVASHELRTPLNALALNLQLGRTRLRKGVAVDADLLERMLHQVDFMARMVGDLLDASRLDRGKLEIRRQPMDLSALVASTVSELRKHSDQHELTLEMPGAPVSLEADPTRIEQVVWNLIDNAFKYCPDGRRVDVRLDVKGGVATLSVTDDGPGIAPEERARLFTRFFRVRNASSEEIPGLGLGLYICRVIVELHGGGIHVESEPGRGTRFYFTLPLR